MHLRHALSLVFTLVLAVMLAGCGTTPATPTPTPAVAATIAPTATLPPASPTLAPTPFPAPTETSPLGDLTVALLTSGPVDDGGWNQAAFEGLQALEQQGATIANTEDVAQHDQNNLIRSYAEGGFGIIIGHGFEFGDALTAVAQEYPDTRFIQIGGAAANPGNLASYQFRPGEAGYAAGILAGLMVGSGRLGAVGSVETPTSAADFTAFWQAAQQVNAKVKETPVVYTGSWTDTVKAKAAALAQFDAGAGLILANGDGAHAGVIEAAQENGQVFVIGWTPSQAQMAADMVLTSNQRRVDKVLIDAVLAIQDGSMEWRNHIVGFGDGAQSFAPYSEAVPAEVAAEVDAVIQALVDGVILLDEAGHVVKDEHHK